MFEGGGFGVGLTVGVLDLPTWPAELEPAGVTARPTRLGEAMPVAARSDAQLAVELQRIAQVEARLAAYRAELVVELAARRPDTTDPRDGEPGAAASEWLPGPGRVPAGVSEFFADELAQVLSCSRAAATTLTELSAVLLDHLPATWAELADGALGWPRARAIAAELTAPARELAPSVIAAVEAAVLPAAGRLSVSGLRARSAVN